MKAEIYIDVDTLLSYMSEMGPEEFQTSLSPYVGNGYSGMKGSGGDLYGIREFQPGDDLKYVNHRATAKSGKLHLNVFLEERLLSAYILLDQCPHMFFTSTHCMKSVVAAKKAAALLYAYFKKGHRVSGDVFSYDRHYLLSETSVPNLCEDWLTEIALLNKALLETDKEVNLKALSRALVRCLNQNLFGKDIYVISDFLQCEHEKCLELLSTLSRHNRVYLIQVSDKLEERPPVNVWLQGEKNDFKFRNQTVLQQYEKQRAEIKQLFIDFSRDHDLPFTELFT